MFCSFFFPQEAPIQSSMSDTCALEIIRGRLRKTDRTVMIVFRLEIVFKLTLFPWCCDLQVEWSVKSHSDLHCIMIQWRFCYFARLILLGTWPSTADCYHYCLRALLLGSDLFQYSIDSLGVADVCLTSATASQRFRPFCPKRFHLESIYSYIWLYMITILYTFVYCLYTFAQLNPTMLQWAGLASGIVAGTEGAGAGKISFLDHPILMLFFLAFCFCSNFSMSWSWWTTCRFRWVLVRKKTGARFAHHCMAAREARQRLFFWQRRFFGAETNEEPGRDPKWSRQPDSHMGWCLSWWIEKRRY